MNRRKFFGLLSAAGAAGAASMLPATLSAEIQAPIVIPKPRFIDISGRPLNSVTMHIMLALLSVKPTEIWMGDHHARALTAESFPESPEHFSLWEFKDIPVKRWKGTEHSHVHFFAANSLIGVIKAPPESFNPFLAIKKFVADQNAAGHKDLLLFTSRSGQWAFQQYDFEEGGNLGTPIGHERCYLLYGKPRNDGLPTPKMPVPGQIGRFAGIPIAAIEVTPGITASDLRYALDIAVGALSGGKAELIGRER